MTPPIKPAPKAPTASTAPSPTPTQWSTMPTREKHPASGCSSRGDAPGNRSTLNKPSPDTLICTDGLFFSQLLVPPVDAEPDRQGFGGGGIALPVRAEPVPTQLIDELAQRLSGQPEGPLSFTLLMPNLGSVRVHTHKTENRWNVQLGFARRDVLKRLQGHADACRDSLSQALGQDVELDMQEDLEA
ncbi:type III secretion system HrpP C-terminal domain-containing protein [Pseudomonas sp. CFBP 5748]